jgi:hypothetical protein
VLKAETQLQIANKVKTNSKNKQPKLTLFFMGFPTTYSFSRKNQEFMSPLNNVMFFSEKSGMGPTALIENFFPCRAIFIYPRKSENSGFFTPENVDKVSFRRK